MEKNNLCYIPSTSHSSKRSNRNIDLTFTNIGGARGETLNTGTSDHWPVMITCENVCFDKNRMFPFVNWKVFEAILALLQEFWWKQQGIGMQADEWYMNYVRFLAALKNRLTKWKEKEKFLTRIASLSHSEAERDKKSEKQILPSGKNRRYIRRDKSVVKSINTRSENLTLQDTNRVNGKSSYSKFKKHMTTLKELFGYTSLEFTNIDHCLSRN